MDNLTQLCSLQAEVERLNGILTRERDLRHKAESRERDAWLAANEMRKEILALKMQLCVCGNRS